MDDRVHEGRCGHLHGWIFAYIPKPCLRSARSALEKRLVSHTSRADRVGAVREVVSDGHVDFVDVVSTEVGECIPAVTAFLPDERRRGFGDCDVT